MKTTKTSVKNPEPREVNLAASLTIEAAEAPPEGGKHRNRRFTMVAYTGGPMRIAGFSYPVVVDLAGLDLARASFPVFVGHQQDPDYLLGQADRVEVVGTNLVASGDVIDVAPKARQVVEAHDRGFRWQASIGALVLAREYVPEGRTINVNGSALSGPFIVARKAELGEISFVFSGADRNTSAVIAAGARRAGKENAIMDESVQDNVDVVAAEGEVVEGREQPEAGKEAGPSAPEGKEQADAAKAEKIEAQARTATGPIPRPQPRASPSRRPRRSVEAKCSCAIEASPRSQRSPSSCR